MWHWGEAAASGRGCSRKTRVGVVCLYNLFMRVVQGSGWLRLRGAAVKVGNVE